MLRRYGCGEAVPQLASVHAKVRKDGGEGFGRTPDLIGALVGMVRGMEALEMSMRRTSWMGANWVHVDSPKRDCDECSISSKAKYSVSEGQGGFMLFLVALMEVYI